MQYMSRRLRKIFLFFVLLAGGLVLAAYAVLSQEKFGKHPEGERLERIQASPNYRDGQFHNTVPTPVVVGEQTTLRIMWDNRWVDRSRLRPEHLVPTTKLDLKALNPADDLLIWLGHSSYYIQLGGKRFLVDPVFSKNGAPFFFSNKIFEGTDLYAPGDMPKIDFLLITHDHWDHLDHPTVKALMPKVKTVISPLGVGAHFEDWGYPKEKLLEADWGDALSFENGLTVYFIPARHYSGRTLARYKTLWGGFVLETPERRILLSGDTGYGPHIEEIAKKFDGFDLVSIDGGQYDPRWGLIHMNPDEATRAAEELGAKSFLLAHVGRFSISIHSWDEPFERAMEASKDKSFRLLTPQIGEPVKLGDAEQEFSHWWKNIQ